MRVCAVVSLVLVTGFSGASRAEITWMPVGGAFELTGADLFRMRDEIPDNIEKKLENFRNTPFASEAEFRDVLTFNGADGELLERLVEVARGPGANFGAVSRGPGMATFYVEGETVEIDRDGFTSQSWLADLPAETTAGQTLTPWMDGQCLSVNEEMFWLFSLCAPKVGEDGTSVELWTMSEHVVGLGQEFQTAGDTTVERSGYVRHGLNTMEGFNGGANGNTLFPIAYFDSDEQPFALILDNRYPQEWNLTPAPYALKVKGGDFRLHVITGASFAEIRRRFMAMAGRPPVPPKAMFGLWLSEYGFDSWMEIEGKLSTLEAERFPVSGVMLDLQWFGGIDSSSTSRMGTQSWDVTAFPDPRTNIAALASRGIGVMTIEESYVSAGLEEFAALAKEHALAHDAAGEPLLVNPNGNWWGTGGMIDWTTERARIFWHDYRRAALVDDGVVGHWTDLGEPEMSNPAFVYGEARNEAAVHNSYNVMWLKGIFDGYRRTTPDKRPFMLSRSGGMGMQAYGAALWSGDTGSDYGSLAAQMPQQTHLMWSGLDYYGSDVGGFHRGALGIYPGTREAAMDELYTQWFAYSALFEVPIRPHTENLCNCKETAPDRIGDRASNRENLLLRDAMTPYYYSLAFRAWLEGEPVFPSVDYWYPEAKDAGRLGQVKMIGTEFAAAGAAANAAQTADIYLPAGRWFDFRTLEAVESPGQVFTRSLKDERGEHFALPLFIKDGGVVPMRFPQGQTLTVVGTAANTFNWFDDDGVSTAYQQGDYDQVTVSVDVTSITLRREKGGAERIVPTVLTWAGIGDAPIGKVLVDGVETAFDQQPFGVRVQLPAFEKELKIEMVR
jgi:alpha-glucosidase